MLRNQIQKDFKLSYPTLMNTYKTWDICIRQNARVFVVSALKSHEGCVGVEEGGVEVRGLRDGWLQKLQYC